MSLVASLTQSLRTAYPSNLDKNEERTSRYGAWEAFVNDSKVTGTIMTPDIVSKIKMSFGNSVVVPVIDAENVTIGNARTCNILADDENTSRLITLTFITYAFGFTMTPAQHFNNDVGYQADYDRKLLKYLNKFAATLDAQAVATLEAQKNQFWTGVAPDFYTQVGNVLQVSQAQKNDFLNTASSILEKMDFYGKPNIVHNPNLKPLFNRLLNQGAGNAVNEQFQFSPYGFYGTNRIANGASIESTGYLVQEGSLGVENRNDPDAIMKSRVAGSEWDEVVLPIVNLKVGSYYREACNDASALVAPSGTSNGTAGLTRTKKESFEFSTDVCYLTAYNSNPATRFAPIAKFNITVA